MTLRMAITGASGFVGRQLVPRLMERGADLLLIGRDPDGLARRFNGCRVAGYDDFAGQARGFDLLLHLAVVNNDRAAPWDEVLRTNVELPVAMCRTARDAGIERFAFVSSSHALDETDTADYARSKRLAEEGLETVTGIAKTVLYFPAVVGDELAGKLASLDRLPRTFRKIAVQLLGSLKPLVGVDRIADAVVELSRLDPPQMPGALIVSEPQRRNPFYRIGKRLFDLAFALSVLLVLGWAMVIIWLLVRTQSEGPGLFRQTRVGRNEQEFVCYKFRTMLISTPSVGTHEASAASVTSLGRFLRRTKLDELPQAWNILTNEMSLVGPRPCLPNQIELVNERRARGVFDVTPGITGLAQIKGIDMSDPQRLARCDQQYVGLQSLLLDLKIALRTFLGRGTGDPITYTAAAQPDGP